MTPHRDLRAALTLGHIVPDWSGGDHPGIGWQNAGGAINGRRWSISNGGGYWVVVVRMDCAVDYRERFEDVRAAVVAVARETAQQGEGAACAS